MKFFEHLANYPDNPPLDFINKTQILSVPENHTNIRARLSGDKVKYSHKKWRQSYY